MFGTKRIHLLRVGVFSCLGPRKSESKTPVNGPYFWTQVWFFKLEEVVTGEVYHENDATLMSLQFKNLKHVPYCKFLGF